MVAHASSTQPADPIEATGSDSVESMTMQRAGTALAVRAPAGSAQRPSANVVDGVRAAAAVMGWALWILLALTVAAFLAFAPSML